MKVIKEGGQEQPKKETCHTCKSKLEYIKEDTRYDREGKYIVCPVCNSFIIVP